MSLVVSALSISFLCLSVLVFALVMDRIREPQPEFDIQLCALGIYADVMTHETPQDYYSVERKARDIYLQLCNGYGLPEELASVIVALVMDKWMPPTETTDLQELFA